MKFGKRLRQTVEESLPEYREKFVAYKRLKKEIFQGSRSEGQNSTGPSRGSFMVEFRRELDKVNDFYLNKQEDFIIRFELLSKMARDAVDRPGELTRMGALNLKRRMVDLYGEMSTLEHYSIVNRTGFRKILKKNDKKSGSHSGGSIFQVVLITPFTKVGVLNDMIRDIQDMIHALDSIRHYRESNSPQSAVGMRMSWNGWQGGDRKSSLWKIHAAAEAEIDGPRWSEKLLRHMDCLQASELSVDYQFLSRSQSILYYSLATTSKYSVGYFYVPPGQTLSILAQPRSSCAVLLTGTCLFKRFKTAETCPPVEGESGSQRLKLTRIDQCNAVGPWPSFLFTTDGRGHHLWEAKTPSIIFYLNKPALDVCGSDGSGDEIDSEDEKDEDKEVEENPRE